MDDDSVWWQVRIRMDNLHALVCNNCYKIRAASCDESAGSLPAAKVVGRCYVSEEMYTLHGKRKHTLYIRDMRNTKRIALRIVFFLWNTVMYAQCTCVGEWEWCSICEHKFGP